MLMTVIIASDLGEIMGIMTDVHTTWRACTCKRVQAPGLGLGR